MDKAQAEKLLQEWVGMKRWPHFYRMHRNGTIEPVLEIDGITKAWSKRWHLRTKVGAAEVSTVFLAVNHAHSLNSPPILFETMIFGGPLDGYQERCCTKREAKKMHATAVVKALAKLPSQWARRRWLLIVTLSLGFAFTREDWV